LVGSCRISRLSAFPEKFTVNKSAKVPWAAIIKDPDHFILAEHQPLSGVAEPSKYRAENLRKDWNHWESMQKKGLRGLVFENALKKDLRSPDYIGKGKGKAKAAYIEPSSDEDEASSEDDSSSDDDEMEVEENVDEEEEGEVDGEVDGNAEEETERRMRWQPTGPRMRMVNLLQHLLPHPGPPGTVVLRLAQVLQVRISQNRRNRLGRVRIHRFGRARIHRLGRLQIPISTVQRPIIALLTIWSDI